MTVLIPITKGYSTLIDDEDYERVSPFLWSANVMRNGVYVQRSIRENKRRVTVFLHRFILNAPRGVMVDHADGNPLNNTRANIRLCSASQNSANARFVRNETGFRGVQFMNRPNYQSRPYSARLKWQKKYLFLGYFDTAVKAAEAYDAKAKEVFGEFARLNFSGENT